MNYYNYTVEDGANHELARLTHVPIYFSKNLPIALQRPIGDNFIGKLELTSPLNSGEDYEISNQLMEFYKDIKENYVTGNTFILKIHFLDENSNDEIHNATILETQNICNLSFSLEKREIEHQNYEFITNLTFFFT